MSLQHRNGDLHVLYIIVIIEHLWVIISYEHNILEKGNHNCYKGRRSCDLIVVEFITTYAISAYHH
jgi:hypothetical protein